ncbi:MAG: GNAT family N-acetyltransferase [Anaerolineales bacterium]|nr:GNAT family N-acetyltransferase [Anaerolineales bacterium]
MKFRFAPMNKQFAQVIVESWKYESEYSLHDYSNEAEHLLDSASWGTGLFAALDENGELVGELTIEFFDEQGNYLEYDDYSEDKVNQAEMWIGFGLKPELTGRGLGAGFVSACIEFAIREHRYRGKYVRLGVPAFNQRAIKVYERLGFVEFNREWGEIEGRKFEAVQMMKPL